MCPVTRQKLFKLEQIMNHCQIFGLSITAADMKTAVEWTCHKLNELKGRYITFANTHAVVMAQEFPKYFRVQNAAAGIFADGAPIAGYERKHGYPEAERVAGPDFMAEIFKISPRKGYRHYFYGGSEETLAKLKNSLEKRYPGIEIVGMYSPPYEKGLRKDYREDIERINHTKADFIWVGLGAPKQEFWMYRQKGKVCGVMLGVGAGFDFHSGMVRRAPGWMQKCGMEWFYRLLQEPGRLGKRYLRTNFKFIRLCFCEKLGIKGRIHGKN